jgi:hypothetical protein
MSSKAIKDIKKGDKLYCRDTMEEAWVATEDAKYITEEDQWQVHLTFRDGEPERFMETTGLEHYGPKLTSEPTYISREGIKKSNDNTGSTK